MHLLDWLIVFAFLVISILAHWPIAALQLVVVVGVIILARVLRGERL